MNTDLTSRAAAFLQPLGELNWSCIDEIREKTEPVMRNLAGDKGFLRELTLSIVDDPVRRRLCERDYALSKYVLYNDSRDRFRLRLHIMRDSEAEAPHSHRNCFASLIVSGGYEHIFFSPLDDGETLVSAVELKPVLRRWEGEGSHYAIHHSVIHSTRTAGEPCVTLMVRGPSLRRQAVNIDLLQQKSWWHRGAADMTEDDAARVHRLDSDKDMADMISYLKERSVI